MGNSAMFRIAGVLREKVYNLLPYSMLKNAYDLGVRLMFGKKYQEMLHYLEEQNNSEIEALLPNIREQGKLSAIYGEWTKEYENLPDMVSKDKVSGFYYVDHKCCDGSVKRIFLREGLSHAASRTYYESIIMEQDERSPHCYLTREIKTDLYGIAGGTILDLGGAEGVFALECVDHVDRVYCFDADPKWIEPLRNTLSPFRDKVELVSKYVSDVTEGDYITIDGFFGNDIPKDIRIIKMDIEGFEQNALVGMKRTINENPNAILLICTYHKPQAETEIKRMMDEWGYSGKERPGYIFFWAGENFIEPYARRGVIEFRRQR